ncbi:arsenate reductase (glutaredoxin) [Kistimonas asteriae]|uniref:arsenate reductase (glutaredoxin) n=1 Tax=Kistimonas asteriae TaxID=517724 RepID=UPI001BA9DFEC|nr:arsenate reductase (glutaredoxin) [Kistimonas asteriae]
MSDVTIYHNPRCSKSRQTLQLLEEQGINPDIVLYLETPPDRDTLKAIISKLGIPIRELLRTGEQEYKDNTLKNPALDDEALLDAMVRWPKLIQRPIVVKGNNARIGRPPEAVLEIL